MEKKIFLFFGILLVSFFIGCEDKDPQKEVKDFCVFDVSNETEWDYWALGKDGGYFFVKTNNSLPKTIFYKPDKNQDGYPIYLDDNGYPEMVTIAGYIFIFDNFEGNKMDIAVISPQGGFNVMREVQTDYNWDDLINKGSNSKSSDVSEIIKWTGHVIAVASCGIGIITTPAGVGIPLVALGCGATFVGLALEVVPEDFEILGLTAESVGVYATILGCAKSGITCTLDLASLAFTVAAAMLEDIENNNVLINQVPTRVNMFLDKEDIQILQDAGLVINTGLIPPDITGYYYLNNWKNLSTGAQYINYSYKFFNQTSDNDIQVEFSTANSNASGSGAFLSGQTNSFSVYCEIVDNINEEDHIVMIRSATIYSGIVSSSGIIDFQKGFVIVEKQNDINDQYMDVGDSRVVYEADFLAERVSTFPYFPKNSDSDRINEMKK
ncbi:MAG: hypothetical protein MUE74_02200 [Bacteroidales bacterium]|nr:hypothetical protein [Bacteroidales bacterium]